MRNERRTSGSGRGDERPAAERRHGARRLLSPPRWSRPAARHDAAAARVHPPLPAPCPAAWLPPHPPLRLARQWCMQGQYCTCPRTAGRGTAAGACRRARTTGLAAPLSLLRRAHEHHRDLRALAATSRPAAPVRNNREHRVVIRHGLHSPDAATSLFRQRPPDTPVTGNRADGLGIGCNQILILAAPGETSHAPSAHSFCRRAGFAIIADRQNPKSP